MRAGWGRVCTARPVVGVRVVARGLALLELGQGAVELAVQHGFVADQLDEAIVGGEGAG